MVLVQEENNLYKPDLSYEEFLEANQYKKRMRFDSFAVGTLGTLGSIFIFYSRWSRYIYNREYRE